MSLRTTYASPFSAALTGEMRNRVLRNTYMLLAVTLIPTLAGAALGMALDLRAAALAHPWMVMGGELVAMFGLMFMVQRNSTSGAGVAWLLAFTGVMGFTLASTLQSVLMLPHGGQTIAAAAGGTAAIFFAMALVAANPKRDLSTWAKGLTIGLVALLFAMVANIFFAVPALTLTISTLAVILFSALLAFDINRIVQGGETNYITATMSVYLDVINIFMQLLQLIAILSGGRRD